MGNRKLIVPDPRRRRLITGLGALGAGALLTGCDSLSRNEQVQDALGQVDRLTRAAQRLVSSRQSLAREFDKSQIAPSFRGNGTTDPSNTAYRQMAANNFADYRLRIDGLVRNPGQFSLDDLKAMPSRTQITRHDCVEGWSCIGQWTGAVLGGVLDRVKPTADARFVVFHCADNTYGGPDKYYESLDMVEAYHPQTLLAYGLNGDTLPVTNGAPIRLRAERQLGYKQAKYIMHIELVNSFADIQGGNGGYWEDRGYEWWGGI
ncbi:molybdopterin-binding protein [Salinisphaera aquimarina]|uniref:Molybdopterin-binding protein n=1 Tax=Salinisphaera aquimarina TaxID=2094031 RepID=A0ABV7EU31_9GAMM